MRRVRCDACAAGQVSRSRTCSECVPVKFVSSVDLPTEGKPISAARTRLGKRKDSEACRKSPTHSGVTIFLNLRAEAAFSTHALATRARTPADGGFRTASTPNTHLEAVTSLGGGAGRGLKQLGAQLRKLRLQTPEVVRRRLRCGVRVRQRLPREPLSCLQRRTLFFCVFAISASISFMRSRIPCTRDARQRSARCRHTWVQARAMAAAPGATRRARCCWRTRRRQAVSCSSTAAHCWGTGRCRVAVPAAKARAESALATPACSPGVCSARRGSLTCAARRWL